MSYHEDKALMLQSVKWAVEACSAIQNIGGSVTLLDSFPDDLIYTMIRNGLQLKVVKR